MTEISNVILTRGNKLLLGLRSPERKSFPDSWAVPGGHLLTGEQAEEAAVREIKEELGVNVSGLSVLPGFKTTAHGKEIAFHMFTTSEWSGGEPIMQNDEHSKLEWFGIEDACQLKHLALTEYKVCFRSLSLSD
jgi:8-oxo-dGTP diphosphatase